MSNRSYLVTNNVQNVLNLRPNYCTTNGRNFVTSHRNNGMESTLSHSINIKHEVGEGVNFLHNSRNSSSSVNSTDSHSTVTTSTPFDSKFINGTTNGNHNTNHVNNFTTNQLFNSSHNDNNTNGSCNTPFPSNSTTSTPTLSNLNTTVTSTLSNPNYFSSLTPIDIFKKEPQNHTFRHQDQS